MAYDSGQARVELLDEVGDATDDLAEALAALGEAFEALDDYNAERLEEQLFRPVQMAYGRARRTHSEFAGRHGLPNRSFAPRPRATPPRASRASSTAAVSAVVRADARISQLQDSMRPVEVGDAELRAGLSEMRRLIADVPRRASELMRGLGR